MTILNWGKKMGPSKKNKNKKKQTKKKRKGIVAEQKKHFKNNFRILAP